jgi:hypothetical protein
MVLLFFRLKWKCIAKKFTIFFFEYFFFKSIKYCRCLLCPKGFSKLFFYQMVVPHLLCLLVNSNLKSQCRGCICIFLFYHQWIKYVLVLTHAALSGGWKCWLQVLHAQFKENKLFQNIHKILYKVVPATCWNRLIWIESVLLSRTSGIFCGICKNSSRYNGI